MNTQITTKANLQKCLDDLIAGTQKHSPAGSLTVGGATYTTAALVQLFQSLADALSAVDAAKAQSQDALAKAATLQGQVLPVVRAYSTWVVAANGSSPATLADYGLAPRKARAPLSTEQQAVANARKAATREARHTMGSRQKKSVSGTITTIVTAASPAAPAPVEQGGVSSAPSATTGASGAIASHATTPATGS